MGLLDKLKGLLGGTAAEARDADQAERQSRLAARLEEARRQDEALQAFLAFKSIRADGAGQMKVVGVTDYQVDLDIISEADEDGPRKAMQTAVLYPEPDNAYDANATQVVIAGKPVGYLPAEKAERYRPLLEAAAAAGRKVTCDALIVGGFLKANGDQASFGVRLSLMPPTKLEKLLAERIA